MAAIFETILRMSLTGSAVILAVLLARLALKKAPKKISYLLWVVVLLRLLCPLSITVELPFGVDPVAEQFVQTLSETPAALRSSRTERPRTHAEAAAAVNADTRLQGETLARNEDAQTQRARSESTGTPSAPPQTLSWSAVLGCVWLAGAAVMLVHSAVSLSRLKRRLRTAVSLGGNLYEADIETPFVLGIVRPKIYLPANLSEAERTYIILHERLHIRCADHIGKLLAFASLTIHWFNPLVWLAFSLAGQDMEMRCDELVMARTGGSVRADYAQSLLNLSSGRRRFAATPLAFGEGTPKARIKNILKWKKPAVIAGVAAAIVVVGLIIVLACEPAAKERTSLGARSARYRVSECVYQAPTISMLYTPENSPQYMLAEDGRLFRADRGAREAQTDGTLEWSDGALWNEINHLQSADLTPEALQAPFDEFADWQEAQTAKERVAGATDVWRANGEDGQYLLLIQTKTEGLYLMGCGEDRQGEAFVVYLWKLERTEDALPIGRLEQALRDGANDPSVSLFACYALENGFIVGGQSGSRMHFAIYETRGSDYRMTARADMGSESLTSSTIVQTAGLDTSVTVALSSREDLSYVTARAGEFYQQMGVSGCPAMAVFVWPQTLSEGTQADVQFYNAVDERLDAAQSGSGGEQDTSQPPQGLEAVLAALPALYNEKAEWLEDAEESLWGAYYDVNGKRVIKTEDMEAIYGAPIRTDRQQMYPNEYAMVVTYPGGSQASGYCNEAGEIAQVGSLYLLPADGLTVCGLSFGTPWQDVVSQFCCESAEQFDELMYGQKAILLYGTYVHFGNFGFIAFDDSGMLRAIEYHHGGSVVRFCFTDGLLSAVSYQEEEAIRLPYAPAGEEAGAFTAQGDEGLEMLDAFVYG